jgi:hypothetical protein
VYIESGNTSSVTSLQGCSAGNGITVDVLNVHIECLSLFDFEPCTEHLSTQLQHNLSMKVRHGAAYLGIINFLTYKTDANYYKDRLRLVLLISCLRTDWIEYGASCVGSALLGLR